ncbi:hypothetical protein E4U21_007374 [Claviceps maximensis]|nr:hypothetical protein E4U21_007374 [Claviceps maximensis]
MPPAATGQLVSQYSMPYAQFIPRQQRRETAHTAHTAYTVVTARSAQSDLGSKFGAVAPSTCPGEIYELA